MVAGLQRPLRSRYAVYLTASRWAAPRRSEGLSPGMDCLRPIRSHRESLRFEVQTLFKYPWREYPIGTAGRYAMTHAKPALGSLRC